MKKWPLRAESSCFFLVGRSTWWLCHVPIAPLPPPLEVHIPQRRMKGWQVHCKASVTPCFQSDCYCGHVLPLCSVPAATFLFSLGTVGCWKAAATSDSSRKNWMWCSDIMIVCDIMTSFLDSTWVREKWKRKLTSHCSCSWNCIWRLWLAVGEVWQGGMTSLWSVAVKASWRANVCTSKYASSCLVLDTAPKSKGSVSMGLDWGHLHVCQAGFWHGRISYSN